MRFPVIALLVVVLIAGCDNNRAEKTERVRNLSQPELAEIFARLDELQRKGAPSNLSSQQIPPVVARLKPEGVVIRDNSAWIHIAGVFDDKVYVFVNGLGGAQADGEIVLSPGEREPQEVLWR